MNTVVNYFYRDEANYKDWFEFVVNGEMTDEDYATIRGAMIGCEYFIPEAVGMNGSGLVEDAAEAEISWFEISGYNLTDQKADGMTVAQLVENFEKAAECGWDLDECERRLYGI